MSEQDPRHDAKAEERVHQALNDLLAVCADVVRRNGGGKGGTWFEVPDPASFGGVDGLKLIGYHRVIERLQKQLDKTLGVFREHEQAVTEYDRKLFGKPEGWTGPEIRRPWDSTPTPGGSESSD